MKFKNFYVNNYDKHKLLFQNNNNNFFKNSDHQQQQQQQQSSSNNSTTHFNNISDNKLNYSLKILKDSSFKYKNNKFISSTSIKNNNNNKNTSTTYLNNHNQNTSKLYQTKEISSKPPKYISNKTKLPNNIKKSITSIKRKPPAFNPPKKKIAKINSFMSYKETIKQKSKNIEDFINKSSNKHNSDDIVNRFLESRNKQYKKLLESIKSPNRKVLGRVDNLNNIFVRNSHKTINITNQQYNKENIIPNLNYTNIITNKYYPKNKIEDLKTKSIKEWESFHFPWTSKINTFLKVFGLIEFRKNQREIINATLSGNDCYALMPTGSGKSLCYQLSALIYEGTTVVISPLISLIQDQVNSLTTRNISVASLTSENHKTYDKDIWRQIRESEIKLLYLTPEKLIASEAVKVNLLKSKYPPKFVIDEAHCVSNWGHDFRKDYLKLFIIKNTFPKSTIMALTATATDLISSDIINNLNMSNKTICFHQSFNRVNLTYSVEKKKKNTVQILASWIRENYPDSSGIVYCISRKECESVANALQEENINASYYHAGMNSRDRTTTQSNWSNDITDVVVATIAFGMGIDKSDVKFVVHYSMPKSPSNYYQETGRAGRDGEKASCLLYYSYSDKRRLEFMLRDSETGSMRNKELISRDIESLNKMATFCENDVECRRYLMLKHFGEQFDSSKCNKTCDNCINLTSIEERDVTSITLSIIDIMKYLSIKIRKISYYHLTQMIRGNSFKNPKDNFLKNHKYYGIGSEYHINDTIRLLHLLLEKRILREEIIRNQYGGSYCNILLGNNAGMFMRTKKVNGEIILMRMKKKTLKEDQNKKKITKYKNDNKNDNNHSIDDSNKIKINSTLAISLFNQLNECRYKIQKNTKTKENPRGININTIMPIDACRIFAMELPSTIEQMALVMNVGASIYRCNFLEVIKDFAIENNLKLAGRDKKLSKKCSSRLRKILKNNRVALSKYF